MRIRVNLASAMVAAVAVIVTGCAGPEEKLGRGLMNVTEFVRLGEIRRSVEQTALWDGGKHSPYTTGLIRGFNRSVARTAVGAFEVATFPIPTPTYGPLFASTNMIYPDSSIRTKSYPFGGLTLSETPAYPDSYKPGLIADTTFATDTSLGFSGGDVAPFVPGSRLRIFDH